VYSDAVRLALAALLAGTVAAAGARVEAAREHKTEAINELFARAGVAYLRPGCCCGVQGR